MKCQINISIKTYKHQRNSSNQNNLAKLPDIEFKRMIIIMFKKLKQVKEINKIRMWTQTMNMEFVILRKPKLNGVNEKVTKSS